jgi:hypothetical protein
MLIPLKALPVTGSAFKGNHVNLMLLFFMTFGTACRYCKSGFAIVAGAAGFALSHISHSHPFAVTVGENFGVAVVALIGGGMEIMAEVADNSATAALKGQVGWFVVDMTGAAVCFNGEGDLAIMAATA